ncbi:MAG: hypothetical protein AB7S26_11570 [Sandaracinaceae bacterium]
MNIEEWVGKVGAAKPGTPAGRDKLLGELYEAGFPSQRTADRSNGGGPHTVLVWIDGPGPKGAVFVVPDGELDASLREAFEAANRLVLRDLSDCSTYQLGAFLRIEAATGRKSSDALEERVRIACEHLDEVGASDEEGSLPSGLELRGLHAKLAPYAVGALGSDEGAHPEALDVRLSRSIAVADLTG